MQISLSATNPCHLYPLARELHALGALGTYHSGYPAWRLPGSRGMPVRPHAFRTLVTYGLLKVPERLRMKSRSLFLWQDTGFDRRVGRALGPCDFVHAMPGQCLETFRRARELGARPVLNHATGPVREWVRILAPEYARVGLEVAQESRYDDAYFRREEEEYALADFHCAASTVVRDALVAGGLPEDRIWVVPYGADPGIFHPRGAGREGPFRIVFAGQLGLRKGVRCLLDALQLSGEPDWEVVFYGGMLDEAKRDLESYQGAPRLNFCGSVDREHLADAFRTGSVLVLPSLEEGFGLVVAQALACGLPCVVSDRVGAKDLIRPRENGSVFPVNDPAALAEALHWWQANPRIVTGETSWRKSAETLLQRSREALDRQSPG